MITRKTVLTSKGITRKTVLTSKGSEYETLSGMSTEDLTILQHHVLPARKRIVLRILAERTGVKRG